MPYLTEYNCFGSLYDIKLKALTIRQPFASLILLGKKKFEIRSWQTKYRGQIVICSAQTFHKGSVWVSEKKVIPVNDFMEIMRPKISFPLQCTLALAELVNCRPMEEKDSKESMTAFMENMFCWELENVIPLQNNFVRGIPGLFDLKQNLIHLRHEV